jgi:hypothetical protein
VAALALLATATPASAQARVPAAWVGVMADGPLLGPRADLAREASIMRGAGVGSMRVAFYWRDMQPEAGGSVDFAETDRIVAAAANARVRVLPVLVRSPPWAAGGDTREGAVPDPAAYASWVEAVVRRYGPRGSFWPDRRDVRPMYVRQWQIWNEPDIPRYLSPPSRTSWATAYVRLLRPANRAVKRADPRAQVIAAGLTNRSWLDLRRLYQAGARPHFDAAAIHPFSRRPSNVVKIVRLARQEMRRRGDARKPLMLTELSWSSGQGRSTFNYGWETTERGQAERVTQAFRALARVRTELRIGGVWWYTWLSPPLGDDASFSYSGLRRIRDGRAVNKPAYLAFRRVVRQLRSR